MARCTQKQEDTIEILSPFNSTSGETGFFPNTLIVLYCTKLPAFLSDASSVIEKNEGSPPKGVSTVSPAVHLGWLKLTFTCSVWMYIHLYCDKLVIPEGYLDE